MCHLWWLVVHVQAVYKQSWVNSYWHWLAACRSLKDTGLTSLSSTLFTSLGHLQELWAWRFHQLILFAVSYCQCWSWFRYLDLNTLTGSNFLGTIGSLKKLTVLWVQMACIWLPFKKCCTLESQTWKSQTAVCCMLAGLQGARMQYWQVWRKIIRDGCVHKKMMLLSWHALMPLAGAWRRQAWQPVMWMCLQTMSPYKNCKLLMYVCTFILHLPFHNLQIGRIFYTAWWYLL